MKRKLMLMMTAAAILNMGTFVMAAQDNGGDGNGGNAKKHKEAIAAKVKEHKSAQTKAAGSDANDKATATQRETRRENYIDKRQDNQEKRIQHGINKGYLTADETKSLQIQQQKIADMESTFKSDGKLSKDEMSNLRDAINVASVNIWAEKHDTDGKQMATYRLGKNVYAKDSYTSLLSNQNLTGAEAKALTGDFRKMMDLKRSLSNDNLSADARAQKQTEYDNLLNKYFEVR